MTTIEVFALLEEHGYKKWEIGLLDPWWVHNIIFYPRREKNNALIPRRDTHIDSNLTAQEAFWIRYKNFGFADWKIEDLWEEYNRGGKKVTVTVELKAGGDLADVARSIRADLSSVTIGGRAGLGGRVGGGARGFGGGGPVRSLSDLLDRGIKQATRTGSLSDLLGPAIRPNISTIAGREGFGGDKIGYRGSIEALDRILGRTPRAGFTGDKIGYSGSQESLDKILGRAHPFAQPAMDYYQKEATDNLKKLAINASLLSGSFALIVSQVPALSNTFFGSLKLAAGELAIVFIPAIIEAAKFFQSIASTIRSLNEATGGLLGQIAKAIMVPVLLIGMGAIVVKVGSWLFGMGEAAVGATVALGRLAIAGGASGAAGAAGVGAAAAGGGMIARAGAFAVAHPVVTTIAAVAAIAYGAYQLIKTREAPAISLDFRNFSDSIEGMEERLQQEALKDPMQMQQTEQLIRAMQELASQIGMINVNNTRVMPWQVGN